MSSNHGERDGARDGEVSAATQQHTTSSKVLDESNSITDDDNQSGLLYKVDDIPPWPVLLVYGVQV